MVYYVYVLDYKCMGAPIFLLLRASKCLNPALPLTLKKPQRYYSDLHDITSIYIYIS